MPALVVLFATGCFVTLEPHAPDGGAFPDVVGSGDCQATLSACVSGGLSGRCANGECCTGCLVMNPGAPSVYTCRSGTEDTACGPNGICVDCTAFRQTCAPGMGCR